MNNVYPDKLYLQIEISSSEIKKETGVFPPPNLLLVMLAANKIDLLHKARNQPRGSCGDDTDDGHSWPPDFKDMLIFSKYNQYATNLQVFGAPFSMKSFL